MGRATTRARVNRAFHAKEDAMRKIARRQFLRSATAGAAAAVAVHIVPRHVLGQGQTPPSEKINIAAVGAAGQGRSDIEQMRTENIVALCDVDWRHAANTFKTFPDAKKFKDYRVMLDEAKDVD